MDDLTPRPAPPIPDPTETAPPSTPAAPKATGDATSGIIPYKNMSALMAYYLGVFSIIPCFPLGLTALFLGLKGLKYSKEHPETKGAVHAWIGIVAGGIFGFIWLVVTLLTILGIMFG